MSGERTGWERLNAYVDGELAPHERAEVAGEIAGRPDIASEVAALTRLKAALGDTLEPLAWNDVAPATEAGWRGLPWRRIAAGVVVALGLAAAAATIPWPADERTAWLERPVAAHDAWVASGTRELADGGAGPLLVGFATLGNGAEIPDLSAAKLTVTGVRFRPAEGDLSPAMHVAYAGTRGCRVSLWITFSPPDLDAALSLHRLGAYRAYAWRAGDLAYALVSAMDPTRFEVIARTAHKVTLERAQPDTETATALRRSREQSPPCSA